MPLEMAAELVGKEGQVELGDAPGPRAHGILTRELYRLLERADTRSETWGDLERVLKEAFDDGVAVQVADATRGQLVLAGTAHARAGALLARLDEQRVRNIIAGLREAVERREQQEDYWPEGRLNLGIAYACVGEYEDARHWLEEAVDMFRHPSDIGRSKFVAA